MHSFNQLFHLPHHKTKSLTLFYITSSLRTFMISFLALFLPPIVYSRFLVLHPQKEALILTVIFILIIYLAHALSITLVTRISAKFGLRSCFILGQFLSIIFLLLLQHLEVLWIMGVAFIIWGTAVTFWWFAYHMYFVENGKPAQFGQEMGTLEVFGILLTMTAPFLSGYTLKYFGYSYIIYASIFIGLITIVLSFRLKGDDKQNPVYFSDIVSEFKNRSKDVPAFIGIGFDDTVSAVIWPILLFIVLKDYVLLGIFSTLVIFVSLIALYFAGKFTDKRPKEQLEKLGAVMTALAWLGRTFIQYIPILFISDILYRVFFGFFRFPITAIAYSHATEDTNKAKYIAFRESSFRIGNFAALLCFVGLVAMDLPLWYIFILCSLFCLLPISAKE